MNWKYDSENDQHTWKANNIITYIIYDSSTHIDYPSNKHAALRDVTSSCDLTQGYFNKKGEIVCGSAMFCACGLNDDAKFNTLHEAKDICEKDYSYIKAHLIEVLRDQKDF